MNRRQALSLIAGTTAAATAANGLGGGATAIAQAQPAPAGPFRLPPLGYGYDALEPHIDTTTMLIHHDYHHAAYVNACKRPPGHRRKIETNMAIGAKPA
jgi:Fe-Mn family superoxide dismutase